MLKLMLSISLLFYSYSIDDFKVNSITYSVNESANTSFLLSIELYSRVKDVIELKIYFYDINKNMISNKYYSSVLEIEKSKNTIAKIPYKIEQNMFLRIQFYNDNTLNHVFDLFFPVYPSEVNVCDLNKNNYCQSNSPVLVTYNNGKIEEKMSKIFLVNEMLEFYSFDNRLNIERIKMSSNLFTDRGYAYLFLNERIEEFFVYYNNGYYFPLILNDNHGLIVPSLEGEYYLDLIEGKTYDYYEIDSLHTNDILFPYVDNTYYITLKVIDGFIGFNEVTLNFSLNVLGKLIGYCVDSKYCLRRDYK